MSTMFGLPATVHYCRRCVMSNQKPNSSVEYKNSSADRTTIGFDADGLCDACRFTEVKDAIDWKKREDMLVALLDRFRRDDGRFDVVVPASGGKDSFFTAHVLKHRYGMHPLTVTWAPHIYTEVGWRNLQAMITNAGVDNILYTPNGKVHRLLTRLAFLNMLHPFQPFVLGQKNLGPRTSIAYDIPLVMYGESNIEYGDADDDGEEMAADYFAAEASPDDTFLAGVSVRQLLDEHGVAWHDLQPYLPVAPADLRRARTSVRYLGYYLKWDPQECYYYSVEHGGFSPAEDRSEGTYSKYTELDDKLIPLHFYCMHAKFGIGRAMYDAAQEIRSGKITREEGVALVRRYDGEFPARWLDEVLDYMQLDAATFEATVDRFRPPHLWQRVDGRWALRHPVE